MSPSKASKPAKKSKRKLVHHTWEYPKGSGIKIARMPNKTGGTEYGECFQVRIPAALLGRVGNHAQAGQREFFQTKTKDDAEKYAEDRLIALRKHGSSFAELPPLAQKQAIVAWGILQQHGIGFVEAANAAVSALRPAGGIRTVTAVLAELRESKRARFERKELRPKSWYDYRTRIVKISAVRI